MAEDEDMYDALFASGHEEAGDDMDLYGDLTVGDVEEKKPNGSSSLTSSRRDDVYGDAEESQDEENEDDESVQVMLGEMNSETVKNQKFAPLQRRPSRGPSNTSHSIDNTSSTPVPAPVKKWSGAEETENLLKSMDEQPKSESATASKASAPSAPISAAAPVYEYPASQIQASILIGNMPWWVTDVRLESMLNRFGTVKLLRFFEDRITGKSKGGAFAEFTDAESAKRAIESMANRDVDGRKITVTSVSEATMKRLCTPYLSGGIPWVHGGGTAGTAPVQELAKDMEEDRDRERERERDRQKQTDRGRIGGGGGGREYGRRDGRHPPPPPPNQWGPRFGDPWMMGRGYGMAPRPPFMPPDMGFPGFPPYMPPYMMDPHLRPPMGDMWPNQRFPPMMDPGYFESGGASAGDDDRDSHSRKRSRDRSDSRSRSREKERHRESKRSKDDRERDRERDKEREKGKDEREKRAAKEPERERDKDKEDRDTGKEKRKESRERERSRSDRNRDKEKEKERERPKDSREGKDTRERERDKEREREKEKERHAESAGKHGDRERDKEKEREKEKEKDSGSSKRTEKKESRTRRDETDEDRSHRSKKRS